MAKKENFDGPLPTVGSGTRCRFCEIVKICFTIKTFSVEMGFTSKTFGGWGEAREKAVAIETEMGRERERREEKSDERGAEELRS